jgi:hypothetical protein
MDNPRKKTILTDRVLALTTIFLMALGWRGHAATVSTLPGWRQSNTSGFGNPANNTIGTLAVFNGWLYAGTWNEDGAQLWRTSNGQTWSQVTQPWTVSNTEVYCAIPYGSYLYIGTGNTSGGEIWRTNGTGWEQVASGGLGDANNYGFYAFAIFSNSLYVATANLAPAIGGSGNGVEIWRSQNGALGSWQQVNADGFGAGSTYPDVVMDVYQGYLYVGSSLVNDSTSIAQLWRTQDGTTWDPVFMDGIGDNGNTHVSAMAEFKGNFYLGMRNAAGGQLWRSEDGVNWTAVFTDGLGNPQNSRPYGLIVFDDHMYLVFSNVRTGAEVWQSSDGESWRQIVAEGWGDANNGFADYFDKAAAVFNQSLYIGTANYEEGGEIWQQLHLIHLPMIIRSSP